MWREKSPFSGNLWKKDLQSTSAAIEHLWVCRRWLIFLLVFSFRYFSNFCQKRLLWFEYLLLQKSATVCWERELLFACGEINQFNSAEPFYKPCSVGRGKSIERLWNLLWQLLGCYYCSTLSSCSMRHQNTFMAPLPTIYLSSTQKVHKCVENRE